MARRSTPATERSNGTVVEWLDERGFGFIEADSGERLFFHISEVRLRHGRARIGDAVSFAVGVGRNGKHAAVDVVVAGVNPRIQGASKRGSNEPFARESYRVYAAFLLVAALLLAVVLDRAPLWLPLVYLVLGLISASLYASDKANAEGGRWRTREKTLLGVDLLGGIIGGLLAQHICRHKTAKPSFIVATAAIATLHLVALSAIAAGWLSLAPADALIRQFVTALSA